MGTLLFYAFVPAVVSLIVSVILFIREQAVEIESFTGRISTDPSKLYGSSGGGEVPKNKGNAKP